VSTCFGGDDHGRGRPADGREVASEEDDGSPRGSVRITRFRLRRNRSLPSMSTSNLWVRRRFCSAFLCQACSVFFIEKDQWWGVHLCAFFST
jgi:hypothetical protein